MNAVVQEQKLTNTDREIAVLDTLTNALCVLREKGVGSVYSVSPNRDVGSRIAMDYADLVRVFAGCEATVDEVAGNYWYEVEQDGIRYRAMAGPTSVPRRVTL